MGNLVIRKLAHYPPGETREVRYDEHTGERHLVNPATGKREGWPLAGIILEATPEQAAVTPRFVAQGKREGWLEVEGEKVHHRPGGPPHDPWSVTHTFVHLDAIVFNTVEGPVRYRVVGQPDKYAEHDAAAPVTPDIYEDGATRVDWTYQLELESTPTPSLTPAQAVTTPATTEG